MMGRLCRKIQTYSSIDTEPYILNLPRVRSNSHNIPKVLLYILVHTRHITIIYKSIYHSQTSICLERVRFLRWNFLQYYVVIAYMTANNIIDAQKCRFFLSQLQLELSQSSTFSSDPCLKGIQTRTINMYHDEHKWKPVEGQSINMIMRVCTYIVVSAICRFKSVYSWWFKQACYLFNFPSPTSQLPQPSRMQHGVGCFTSWVYFWYQTPVFIVELLIIFCSFSVTL